MLRQVVTGLGGELSDIELARQVLEIDGSEVPYWLEEVGRLVPVDGDANHVTGPVVKRVGSSRPDPLEDQRPIRAVARQDGQGPIDTTVGAGHARDRG